MPRSRTGEEDVIASLRAATREVHASVEAHFAELLEPAPTLDVYVDFLQTMWCYHAGIEHTLSRIEGWDTLHPAFSPSTRRRDIEHDLRALAARVDFESIELAIAPLALPEGLGITYVTEGSALGARVLHRHLVPRLPIAGASRFLSDHGEHAVARWKSWAAAATDYVAREGGRERIVTAAVAAFRALEARLDAARIGPLRPCGPRPGMTRRLKG